MPRLVNTVNTKSQQVVRVVHQATVPTRGGMRLDNGLIAYPFETLADEMLPVAREALRELDAAREDERLQRRPTDKKP